MEHLALLEHVSKLYGDRIILRDISANLEQGTLTLVCGANGAGKSTLLRLLGGLAKPTQGKVIHADTVRIGYLGHSTFLYPALTAYENLEFWARTHRAKATENHLTAILERMNLHRHAHEATRVFSRGMAQRLNFARILAVDANLLLLDEPFSGLDTQSQVLMRREILAKRAEGAAIALVSHALAADMDMADYVISLKNSKGSMCPAGSHILAGNA